MSKWEIGLIKTIEIGLIKTIEIEQIRTIEIEVTRSHGIGQIQKLEIK
jgi:hypothetical protein